MMKKKGGTMNQEKIGKFIQEIRKSKNITQRELAEKLGVTDKTVSRWENGHYLPDLSLWKELCEILDISMLELMNGETKLDKNISKEEMEDSIFNTIKITNKKVKNMKKKTIIILCISLLLIVGTIGISIYQIQKNKKQEFVPIQFTSRYASIEKEDGWVCSFLILNYQHDYDYYAYHCDNLKYPTLKDFYALGSESDSNGIFYYRIDVPYVSYQFNQKYNDDIRKISDYFANNKLKGTITLKELDDLELTSDIDKQEIVDLYNKAVVARKVTKFGNFIDFQPVKVTESMIIDDYQWIFGYKEEHGELVNVYLDVKYKDTWLKELENKTEEQQAILNKIPEIEEFILKHQTLKLPEEYRINRNYLTLTSMLDNIKKNEYND